MILLNLPLRDGRTVAINPQFVIAVSEDEEGFAYLVTSDGSKWVSNICGPEDVETGRLIEVDGIKQREFQSVSATDRLKHGLLHALQAVGNRLQTQAALTAGAPRLVGIQ